MKKLLVIVSCICWLSANQLDAVELLNNGDLELVGGATANAPPPGWTLTEFPTSGGGTFDVASQIYFGDPDPACGSDPECGKAGLWLKPWAGGNTEPRLMNAVLSQTVPATAGVGYSYTGMSRWEVGYSGGVTTLEPTAPLGSIPSPTRTEMELAFLDAGGGVIGTHLLDLRTVQINFNIWDTHDFDDLFGGGSPLVAPAGTASARISASMFDGAFNTDDFGGQSAFFDEFSLMASNNPGVELLTNADLNIEPAPPASDAFDFWTQTENPSGTDTIGPENFAQNPNTDGFRGAWLKPWAGLNGLSDPVDAVLTQTVPGIEGGSYTFAGWSRFETAFSGGVDNLDPGAPDPNAPSPTEMTMELAFLDVNGSVLGTPITLDLKDDREAQGGGDANDNAWREHMIQGTAPTGTELVRITAAMTDGVFNFEDSNNGIFQSAFFDDFSLDGPAATTLEGDYDGNGLVAAGDLSLVLANWGEDGMPPPDGWVNDFPDGIISAGELSKVLAGWGNTAIVVVPEPASCGVFVLVGALVICHRRRQRRFV